MNVSAKSYVSKKAQDLNPLGSDVFLIWLQEGKELSPSVWENLILLLLGMSGKQQSIHSNGFYLLYRANAGCSN